MANAVDKRRLILDAAITVFARQGFHHCRVSDVADEAGLAYGLVYHYFDSKEQMLNELFSERWALLVEASQDVRNSDAAVVEQNLAAQFGLSLHGICGRPDLHDGRTV